MRGQEEQEGVRTVSYMAFLDGLERSQVINARVQPNFIQNGHVSCHGLRMQLLHLGADVGSCHEMRASRNAVLGDAGVEGGGQKRHHNVVGRHQRGQIAVPGGIHLNALDVA